MEFKHTKSYHKGHPDPQCYRKDYTLLSGEWDFVFDEDDMGEEKGYNRKFPSDALKITVPFAYQSEASGINQPDRLCDVVWYRRSFEVSNTGKVQMLRFIAVDYECKVYVNGKLVGRHIGGYDRFSFDITKFVKQGENELILRVCDPMRPDIFRGKQRYRNQNYSCFYTPSSGVVGDVYLEQLEKAYIKYFSFKGDYKNEKLIIKSELSVNKGRLCVKIDGIEHTFDVEKNAETVIPMPGVKPWSEQEPNLYDVELSLIQGGKVTDKILTYCGFISFAANEGRIFINGKDTFLIAVLDQGYYPDTLTSTTETQMIRDIELIKKAGFNGLRKHEKIEPPLYYYYLDVVGLYTTQEAPSALWYSSDVYKRSFIEIPRQISDLYSHPCIFEYVVYNESWGVDEMRYEKEECELTEKMYRLVKEMAGDRFVLGNEGFDQSLTDIVAVHNYDHTKELLKAYLQRIVTELDEKGNSLNSDCGGWGTIGTRYVFAGDNKYSGQPVMLTEFAGISFNSDGGWGYGGVDGSDGYIERYSALLEAIAEVPEVRGFCNTQITDVMQEKNGLYRFDRSEKVDIRKIKQLHDKFRI